MALEEYNNSGFGLRRVKIRREDNGFGFTLRHFIVYPPELYNNDSQDDERRNPSFLVKSATAVDTIFVRHVVPNGPAERAGLCVGDRIVSVNRRTIFGLSYDNVVQLIQKSPHVLRLEITPKQYDTLQLFFEDTAYRPESNLVPVQPQRQRHIHYAHPTKAGTYSDNYSYPQLGYLHPNNQSWYSNNSNRDPIYGYPSNNVSTESFFLNPAAEQGSMSSQPHPSAGSNPQLFSHLPRPTPYKSSTVWSGSNQPSVRNSGGVTASKAQNKVNQPQTYYPFNQDLHSSTSLGTTHLWKISEIKEEPINSAGAKSAESILTSAGCNSVEFQDHHDTSQRSESMECLNRVPPIQPDRNTSTSGHWPTVRPGQGQRFMSYDENSRPETSSHRRESTGSIPNSNVQSAMVVTMASTNSKMQSSYQPELSDSGSSLGGYNSSAGNTGTGYETKLVDRIRRSCEQKEEFLKRPNQPMQWAPIQSSSSTGFPKELYALPQKFEKIPWPPANIVPTVTTAKPPLIQSCHANSGSFDSQMKNMNNVSVINVQHYQNPSTPSRTSINPVSESDSFSASPSKDGASSSAMYQPSQPRSLSPSWLEYAPRNRTVIVGSRKLHCDPPPNWNPESQNLEGQQQQYNEMSSSGLSPSADGAGEVKLRPRNDDLDDTERLVRRVSYLKATSSPIDMDRNSTSPTSPTLSCGVIKATSPMSDVGRRRSVANKISAEFFPRGRIIRLKQFFEERTQPSAKSSIFKFSVDSPTSEQHRGFGSLLGVRSLDDSMVTRDGQIHYKIRLGESKKGGYNRSWRQGWAQIRQTGCLYISKEPLSRESAVTLTEDAVILALSLRSGVTVEQAEDYSKRKYVLRIKTSYSSLDIANIAENTFSNPTNAHPPPILHSRIHSTPVEILIQADDMNDSGLWLQCLHAQLENNNYCSGNANNNLGIYFGPEFCHLTKPKSLLTSFLPTPTTTSSSHVSQSSEKTTTSSATNNNTLQIGTSNVPQNSASPKNKTWKGKVARQWKKVHNIIETGGDKSSPYSSMGPPMGATFGINLENCPPGENNPFIPRVIEYGIEVVESRGIDMVGLYRIPGNNASVATLTERLNKGEEPNPDKDPKWADVHVVASLIKSFLRRLPDPLLTDDRYQAFIVAADDSEQEKCRERMQLLIQDLPDTNYETLKAVIMHLKHVAEHGEHNRMDARNLAIVFGPTIVRTAEENVTSMVQDMKNQCKIVELLISNADELFSDLRHQEDQSEPRIGRGPPDSLASTTSAQLSSSDELETYNISNAIRLPTLAAVTLYNSAESSIPPPRASPSSPTIESELRASLVHAAMRKASRKIQSPGKDSSSSIHNIYGLPTNSSKKGKPSIDDAGFIRSYAGLNEETEQRVRKFELETRAMLSREDRSPHSSIVNVGAKQLGGIRLLNLDDELQKAKDDLENDDIYDQLAENPSSIIHHRDRGFFSVGSTQRNLSSSSSISSSNSNGTTPSTHPPQKLGPVPFKSTYVPQSLPPKPPVLIQHQHLGSSVPSPLINSKTCGTPILGMRRVSSMDRFGSDKEPQVQDESVTERKFGNVPFFPKYIGGSLDSLSNATGGGGTDGHRNGHSRRGDVICEDFSPKSSEGSDLVTSLTQTLDKKLENLRSNKSDANSFEIFTLNGTEHHPEGLTSRKIEINGDHTANQIQNISSDNTNESKRSKGKSRIGGNGMKKNWRRNSMIERRVNGEVCNVNVVNVKERTSHDDKDYYRNPSLHRLTAEFSRNTTNQADQTNLSKEAKTANNKLTRRDCRRRHSLSGGGDILSITYHDKSIEYPDAPSTSDAQAVEICSTATPTNNEGISVANITRAVLESHV
ncbi:uncharacterized protein LOC110845747 isoform X4 [Folsomia candida]|uniref:uncharacterized protein LOC110845747 isoform X4 n=1 Tax=Folsomia candida TaxID=158441 RepID=UPI001604A2C0|nr:uncharacterized protein LOC110845747 isoform X4 [Folsomia candida]